MTLKLEIGYEQLLQLFRQLPPKQQKQFLKEIEKETAEANEQVNFVQEPTADYARVDMETAAKLLLDDYLHDEELTALTALDAEPFHETRCNLASQSRPHYRG